MSASQTSSHSKWILSGLALALLCAAPLRALEDPMPGWTDRFHVGGNGDLRFEGGQRNALYDRANSFDVYQAGLVFDVDLAPSWSVWYDLNLVREDSGSSFKQEQLYLRKDNVAGLSWLNLKLGRTFMPFGEEYLQWNPISNPLASYTVAMPWNLDSGILAFGDIIEGGKLSYAVAVQNGDDQGGGGVALDDNTGKDLVVKLMAKPLPWLYASSSFLNTGKEGNNTAKSNFGYFSGEAIQPMGAASNITSSVAFEEDVKMTFALTELWANFGYMHVSDGNGHQDDRYIKWYTGQVVQYAPNMAKKLYVVGRYSAIGTFNNNLGSVFEGTIDSPATQSATTPGTLPYTYGFNQVNLIRYSLGVGYWFAPNILGKMEYSWEHSDLVAGFVPSAGQANNQRNFWIGSMSFRF